MTELTVLQICNREIAVVCWYLIIFRLDLTRLGKQRDEKYQLEKTNWVKQTINGKIGVMYAHE